MNFPAGLKYYRGLKGVTQKELAEEVGANNTTISNWEKGISKPDMDTLACLSNYFGITIDELIFFNDAGGGISSKTPKKAVVKNDSLNDGQIDGFRKLRKRPSNDDAEIVALDTSDMIGVPIVENVSAAAGSGVYNPDYIEATDTLQLPTRMLRRGTHLCIPVEGDSMAPTLQDGGFVVSRLLDQSEWGYIKTGYVYVVSTRDGRTLVKRLKNKLHERGVVVCMSDNPEKEYYKDLPLKEDELNTVWEVEWYMTTKMSNIHDTYYSRLQGMADDIDDLKGTVATLVKRLN